MKRIAAIILIVFLIWPKYDWRLTSWPIRQNIGAQERHFCNTITACKNDIGITGKAWLKNYAPMRTETRIEFFYIHGCIIS
jgi:hypothetical protein